MVGLSVQPVRQFTTILFPQVQVFKTKSQSQSICRGEKFYRDLESVICFHSSDSHQLLDSNPKTVSIDFDSPRPLILPPIVFPSSCRSYEEVTQSPILRNT